MSTIIAMPREMLEMALESARSLHPRETILLLRGKAKKNVITISEVIIPPLATHGRSFSTFPAHMLPMDFSLIGSFHSHPSGNPTPSVEDLNRSLGKVILIVAFPYSRIEDIVAFDRNGRKLNVQAT